MARDNLIPTSSRLSRRLNLNDAVFLGLGSMIGAGIFAAAGPAAQAAGSGLLLGVIIAGFLAYLNATTMAQLGAAYPESGGAYAYGRHLLGPLWGFLAGWGFIVGKIASCTAMALTFAAYSFPEYLKPIALLAVLTLTAINYLGVKKTASVTKLLVILVLFVLAIVVWGSLFGGEAQISRLDHWTKDGGVMGIFQSAGLMFFAFAGYARIATLGEEVIDPSKTIPQAIVRALGITLFIYLLTMTTLILTVDVEALKSATAPLALAIESGSFASFSPIVKVGASLASLSVLLSLLAGVGRTIFAMASHGDLPRSLATVHPVHRIPHYAELTVGLIVALILIVSDLKTSIGLSSFAVLSYYAIASVACLRLTPDQRLWPKAFPILGLMVNIGLATLLPITSVLSGSLLMLSGLVAHTCITQLRK